MNPAICPDCGKIRKCLYVKVRPEASEWYCTGCHKSTIIEADELPQLAAQGFLRL